MTERSKKNLANGFLAKVSFRFIFYFLVTKFILTLKYWNRFAALEQIGDGYQGWAFDRRKGRILEP